MTSDPNWMPLRLTYNHFDSVVEDDRGRKVIGCRCGHFNAECRDFHEELCKRWNAYEVLKADAAASPALYEALEELLAVYDSSRDDCDCCSCPGCKARTALRLARGEKGGGDDAA